MELDRAADATCDDDERLFVSGVRVRLVRRVNFPMLTLLKVMNYSTPLDIGNTQHGYDKIESCTALHLQLRNDPKGNRFSEVYKMFSCFSNTNA
jgi:hypothetical protein